MTDVLRDPVAATEPARSPRGFQRPAVGQLGLYGVIIAIVIITSLIEPRFRDPQNFENILRQAVALVILALAQLLPLIARGLDLSVGAQVGLVSVVSATAFINYGLIAGLAAGVVLGLVLGAFNGAIISVFNISALIVTLGALNLFRGAALLLTDAKPKYGLPASIVNFAAGIGPVFVAIAVALAATFILRKTVFGRNLYAVGGNPRAAELAGLNTRRIIFTSYVWAGLLAGIAGLLLTARVASGQPTMGAGLELQAIAAAILGGVALEGGRGSVSNVVLGALLLTLLANAMDLLHITSFVQLIVSGGVLILAVIFDKLRLQRGN